MYTLLIVDDEAIIADGLYEVFQNLNSLELDVYKAYSGDEAMELLKKTQYRHSTYRYACWNEWTAAYGTYSKPMAKV